VRMDAPSWMPALRHALQTAEAAALVDVPKTDLHCHGLLSAPLTTYGMLLGRPLAPPPRLFGDFPSFVRYIMHNLLPALTGPQAVRRLVRASFARMIDEGVVYAEPSFDLFLPELIGVAVEALAELLAEERARVANRLTIAFEVGVSRQAPPEAALERLEAWLATGICRSIDLYDDENVREIQEFVPVYRAAEARGLKLKAHAGELCSAERVRESVELLRLDAVQHGVRAVESPAVLAFLAARGTVLNVCPTSNYALGVAPSLALHQARRLVDAGVTITVNSDDFTLFASGVSDEILNLGRMGFSAEEIARVVENGLRQIAPG
jgi:adenosine deaminase